MSEQLADEHLAEVHSLAAARERRDLGLRAVEAAKVQFPPYLDVRLGDADDSPTLRAWLVPSSPTAYHDALEYGKQNGATVVWGRVRPQRMQANANLSPKLAVIFDHDTLPDAAAVSTAVQAVADHVGPDQCFDISEYYHQEVWRSVTVPELPAQALAA